MTEDSESPTFDMLTITGMPEVGRCKRCKMPMEVGEDVVMRVTDREEDTEHAGVVLKINLIHVACPNPDGR